MENKEKAIHTIIQDVSDVHEAGRAATQNTHFVQRSPHDLPCASGRLDRDLKLLRKDHTAKHNDVRSSFATAHWNVQKFKNDVAPPFGGIQNTSIVSATASRMFVREFGGLGRSCVSVWLLVRGVAS